MTPPIIDVRNLSYRYPDGHEALAGVSFNAAQSECIGLVGPNGAGKSTLLLHLNGVLPDRPVYANRRAALDSNRESGVWIAGMPVIGPNLPVIRQKVGLVFQDPDDQLFCPTVLEDVAFGPLNTGLNAADARTRALEALQAVGLEGLVDRVPNHLSVGERKRACLAGVLACRPEVFALDEPTSGLDPRGRRQFLRLIADLPGTKLIATHDLEIVLELCRRVIILDEGRLCADGSTDELLGNEGLLSRHGLEVPLSLKLGRAT
jgi:energy-coupling factor transporter ATP-binding protein EcfA2